MALLLGSSITISIAPTHTIILSVRFLLLLVQDEILDLSTRIFTFVVLDQFVIIRLFVVFETMVWYKGDDFVLANVSSQIPF